MYGDPNADISIDLQRVDVLLPPSDPSLARKHPLFVRDVVPVARQAVLGPGDLLFLPPGWWHAMRSLEVSFGVSVWF